MNNPRAVKTLIRNKLASSNEETHEWFHEKGITVELIDDDYYFLYADRRGHTSELSDFCNSIIYKNNELLCYHGNEIKSSTLEEAKINPILVWGDKTIFIEYLDGKEIFMFWDHFKDEWVFSDSKKVKTSYRKLVDDKIYNVMSLDIAFTYCFRIVENGPKAGVYLERMYNNEKCKEVEWEEVYRTALRINVGHPDIYQFEGFEKLEDSDFPVYVKDKSANITLLKGLK